MTKDKTATQKKAPVPAAMQSPPSFTRAAQLLDQNKPGEAINAYRQAVFENPYHAPSWANLGTLLRRAGHYEAAAGCTTRATVLAPGRAGYLTNLGNCLVDLDRKEESLKAHAEAFALAPDDFLVRRNYAIALRDFDELEEAVKHFDAAVAMRPDDKQLTWDRAVAVLHLGRFKEGWEVFESRWSQPQLPERAFNAPRWQGENFSGKTLLITEEQGFGDVILSSRYIPMVKARGGKVILECKKPLHRLFSEIQGLDGMVDSGAAGAEFDLHIPIMSLPGIFGTDLKNIPKPAKMHIPAAVPEKAQALLDMAKHDFRVGIVWSGSVTFAGNRKRAVGPEAFLPFAQVPGVRVFSLQKGPRENDLAEFGTQSLVPNLGPLMSDFADTAAVLNQLDLVIMTDSSVAHLAGSVGCPIWNLLSYHPYWLYLQNRSDSPWYDSMRLFRQPEPGDWDSVFADAKKELARAVAAKKAGKWTR